MQLQPKRQQLLLSWTGMAVLVLLANLGHGAADECDAYNVQLQATFPYHITIPCTDEEYATISALVHALVQTDVIVGMNGKPVPDFFLAYETYGPGAVKLTSFEERDFMTSQMQMALPHYTVQDEIEDLYYDYDYDETANESAPDTIMNRNFTESSSSSSSSKDSKDQERAQVTPLIEPYEAAFEAIQPFEDSLRTGPSGDSSDENAKVDGNEGRNLSLNMTEVYDGEGCEADWCGYFFSRPCESIAHNPLEEASPWYQAKLQRFQERVAAAIEHKLRFWARDNDCMCLGNSWELKAVVKKLG